MCLKGANIPTAASESFNGNLESAEAIIEHIRKDFTIPVVVKSATQGSSIGLLSFVMKLSWKQLLQKL